MTDLILSLPCHPLQIKNADNDAVASLQSADAIVVMLGTQSDDVTYAKTAALHFWLLGYEFPSTMMLINRQGVTIVSSANKAKYVEGLDGAGGIKVQVLKRGKDEAQNKQIWQDVIAKIDGSAKGKTIGHFAKDQAVGKVADEWKAVYDEAKAQKGYQEVDVGPAMSVAWSSKDDEEIVSHQSKIRIDLPVARY